MTAAAMLLALSLAAVIACGDLITDGARKPITFAAVVVNAVTPEVRTSVVVRPEVPGSMHFIEIRGDDIDRMQRAVDEIERRLASTARVRNMEHWRTQETGAGAPAATITLSYQFVGPRKLADLVRAAAIEGADLPSTYRLVDQGEVPTGL